LQHGCLASASSAMKGEIFRSAYDRIKGSLLPLVQNQVAQGLTDTG